jgi:hypothetical protein
VRPEDDLFKRAWRFNSDNPRTWDALIKLPINKRKSGVVTVGVEPPSSFPHGPSPMLLIMRGHSARIRNSVILAAT